MKKIPLLLVLARLCLAPAHSTAQVSLSIAVAPPIIPYYEQPDCPVQGYIWTPGYWAYGPDGYFWVPGAWVIPAQAGFLWTPGYWGFSGGYYGWNTGYWGPHVGYYGGVCYGNGYGGVGFTGGRWEGGTFRYVKVNSSSSGNRSSFNGPGGVRTTPTPGERVAMNEHHIAPSSGQRSDEKAASAKNVQAKKNIAYLHPHTTPVQQKPTPVQQHGTAPMQQHSAPMQRQEAPHGGGHPR